MNYFVWKKNSNQLSIKVFSYRVGLIQNQLHNFFFLVEEENLVLTDLIH